MFFSIKPVEILDVVDGPGALVADLAAVERRVHLLPDDGAEDVVQRLAAFRRAVLVQVLEGVESTEVELPGSQFNRFGLTVARPDWLETSYYKVRSKRMQRRRSM